MLQLRADLLNTTRQYFRETGAMEVETPVIVSAAVTDAHIESIGVSLAVDSDRPRYLHTSPEYHMKRLLAAGAGDIFQVCKVFRDHERGRVHSPEFTMVEWYRLNIDHHGLMDDVERLLQHLIGDPVLRADSVRLSYRDAVMTCTGIDPLAATTDDLTECSRKHGFLPDHTAGLRLADWLDLVFVSRVVPTLEPDRLTFIYDYPAALAALARVRRDTAAVAERFEVFCGDLELANGFHELADSREQRRRFEEDRSIRKQAGMPSLQPDERFLAALDAGLPDCSGVALGFDRVLMLAAGTDDIRTTLTFPLATA